MGRWICARLGMLCIIRGRARAWVGAVILQTSLNRSRREEMALLSVAVFARRWPFILFVSVSALLCFTFVLFCLPTATPHEALPLPFLLITFCLVVYAGEWSDILRARLAAVGLPHSRWVIGLYASLVSIACFLLCYFVSKGRFFFPGLFVLLNLPLFILKEKSSVPDAPPLTGQ